MPALETASLRLFPGGSKRFRIHFLRLLIDKMKQPFSFPRRVFCARVLLFRFAPPIEGWRSAESRRVLARHPLGLHLTRQARRLRGALRPITRDARLSALSPWRFWAPVPRFPHRTCVRIGHSELLASGS